jgi:hypothetical protein
MARPGDVLISRSIVCAPKTMRKRFVVSVLGQVWELRRVQPHAYHRIGIPPSGFGFTIQNDMGCSSLGFFGFSASFAPSGEHETGWGIGSLCSEAFFLQRSGAAKTSAERRNPNQPYEGWLRLAG